jgi:hypothetical protein
MGTKVDDPGWGGRMDLDWATRGGACSSAKVLGRRYGGSAKEAFGGPLLVP